MKHLIIFINKIALILIALLYPIFIFFVIITKMLKVMYEALIYEMDYKYILNLSTNLYIDIFEALKNGN